MQKTMIESTTILFPVICDKIYKYNRTILQFLLIEIRRSRLLQHSDVLVLT